MKKVSRSDEKNLPAWVQKTCRYGSKIRRPGENGKTIVKILKYKIL